MNFRLIEPVLFYGLALAAAAISGAGYVTDNPAWQNYTLAGCAIVLIISATTYCWYLAQQNIMQKIEQNQQKIAKKPQISTNKDINIDKINSINTELQALISMVKDFQNQPQDKSEEIEITKK